MAMCSNSTMTVASEEKDEKNLCVLTELVLEKLSQDEDIKIPPECLRFVERAIRTKDYDVDKAAALIKGFGHAIHTLKDMWEDYDQGVVHKLFSPGVLSILASRDELGRQVIILRLGRWKPKQVNFDHHAVAFMLFFGWILAQSKDTQREGVIFLADLTNFGMGQVGGVKISRLTQLIRLLQSGSPGKIKAVHLVFHPRVFGYLFQVAKPFIKEKLSKRIYFHGDDLKSLHQYLRPEILPESLGGTLGEEEANDRDLMQSFERETCLHKDMLKYGMCRE